MSTLRFIAVVAMAFAFGAGCAKKQQVKVAGPAPAPLPVVSEAPTPPPPAPTVAAGEEPLVLSPIHFEFDKSDILDADREILAGIGKNLLANPQRQVVISGHCDERGTVEYNIALGDRRAAAARDYLMRLGVEPARIRTISYGEAQPADSGHDEAAWAKNRRDEFAVEQKSAQR